MEWLCELGGSPFPDRGSIDDDITSSASAMVSQLRKIGFNTELSAVSLKSAHGEAVCSALNFLCDFALKRQRYSIGAPEFIEDGSQDNLVEEDNGDDDDEEIGDGDVMQDEDEGMDGLPAAGSDDFGLEDTVKSVSKKGGKDNAPEKKKPKSGLGFGFDDEDEEDTDDDTPLDRRQKKKSDTFGLDLGDDGFGSKKTNQPDISFQTQEPRFIYSIFYHFFFIFDCLLPFTSVPTLFFSQTRLCPPITFRTDPMAVRG